MLMTPMIVMEMSSIIMIEPKKERLTVRGPSSKAFADGPSSVIDDWKSGAATTFSRVALVHLANSVQLWLL